MNKKYNLLVIAGAAALLSSCGSSKHGLYSTYKRPASIDSVANGLFRDTTATAAAADTLAVSDTLSTGNLQWREMFTDPQLQALISKALHSNLDLQTAELNIESAEAALKSSKLAFYPSLAFAPQAGISKFGDNPNTKTYSLPVQASWQLDVFGKLRNAKKNNEQALIQSKEYVQYVRSQIIANIANAYYTLLMLDEELKITETTRQNWQAMIPVMKEMKTGGMTTQAAIDQSEASLASVEAQIPAMKQSIRETENAICLLLGESFHSIERGTLAGQSFTSKLATGVSLQLLANRPDVRSAEAALAQAFYGVNEAKASFYPNLTVTATAAFTNGSTMVVNPGKFLLSAIASLTQPLFQNGKLQAQLKVAEVQEKQAELSLQKSLLQAGQEVSNAMFAYQIADEKTRAHTRQVEALERALVSTKESFHTGTGTYLEVLTAQQSLLGAQLSQVQDKFASLQAVINLYSALGGGRAE